MTTAFNLLPVPYEGKTLEQTNHESKDSHPSSGLSNVDFSFQQDFSKA